MPELRELESFMMCIKSVPEKIGGGHYYLYYARQ